MNKEPHTANYQRLLTRSTTFGKLSLSYDWFKTTLIATAISTAAAAAAAAAAATPLRPETPNFVAVVRLVA